MSIITYKDSDKMFDVICDQFHLLQMMSRFGIPLGFGEKTVKEVCNENNVDTNTFLAVANYLKHGPQVANCFIDKISVDCIMSYLQQAHSYYLELQFPTIRRKLIEAIDCSQSNEVAFLILKYFDDYLSDVRKHMEMENKKIFTNIHLLLDGKRPEKFHISSYFRSHEGMDKKLQELKNIIIKYYRGGDSKDGSPTDLLNSVLFDIFNVEDDLRAHCQVEDDLFVPAVELLEQKTMENSNLETKDAKSNVSVSLDELSDREKEIVQCIVKGMTNKEVADKLFISVNTVLTHRKNVSKKLGIHSVAGLTIYAIVNGLVKLDDVKM